MAGPSPCCTLVAGPPLLGPPFSRWCGAVGPCPGSPAPEAAPWRRPHCSLWPRSSLVLPCAVLAPAWAAPSPIPGPTCGTRGGGAACPGTRPRCSTLSAAVEYAPTAWRVPWNAGARALTPAGIGTGFAPVPPPGTRWAPSPAAGVGSTNHGRHATASGSPHAPATRRRRSPRPLAGPLAPLRLACSRRPCRRRATLALPHRRRPRADVRRERPLAPPLARANGPPTDPLPIRPSQRQSSNAHEVIVRRHVFRIQTCCAPPLRRAMPSCAVAQANCANAF